jgi:hypothetical protein
MSANAADIALAKLDASGNCLWSESFGATGQVQITLELRVDPAGRWLLGGLANAADFGAGALTGSFIAKFNADGTPAWSKAFSDPCDATNPQLWVDSSGNPLMAGCYTDSIDLGCGPLSSVDAHAVAFVAKFDTNGSCTWSKNYGDEAEVEAVTSDGGGNVLITGNYIGSIAFGAITLTGGDLFLTKLDPSANVLWSVSFGNATSVDTVTGLVVDSADAPALSGATYSGIVSFGCAGAVSGGADGDAWLVQLTSSATCDWNFGGTSAWGWGAMATDSSNDVVVAGRFIGTLGLAGSTLTSSAAGAGDDGFMVEISR